MNMIIITLTNPNRSFEYDLEVPNDLECEKLIDDIIQTIICYNPELMYTTLQSNLYIPKAHMRKLQTGETLEQAGVFNGDYLIIE